MKQSMNQFLGDTGATGPCCPGLKGDTGNKGDKGNDGEKGKIFTHNL